MLTNQSKALAELSWLLQWGGIDSWIKLFMDNFELMFWQSADENTYLKNSDHGLEVIDKYLGDFRVGLYIS